MSNNYTSRYICILHFLTAVYKLQMTANKQYIFGYGSLQNIHSVNNTLSHKASLSEPTFIVRVKNLKRGWYLYMNSNNTFSEPWTTLACYEQGGCTTNGVLIEITSECLIKLDERETGYIRKQIPIDNIECLGGIGASTVRKNRFFNLPANSTVYYYSIDSDYIEPPCDNAPILQSYIDVCLTGCLEIDHRLGNDNYEYSSEFLKTTYGWNNLAYWINDRIFPRRPFEHVPFARIIDTLLSQYLLQV